MWSTFLILLRTGSAQALAGEIDLVWRPCALQRHARDQAGLPVGAAGDTVQHFGFDWTGSDGVYPYAELSAETEIR